MGVDRCSGSVWNGMVMVVSVRVVVGGIMWNGQEWREWMGWMDGCGRKWNEMVKLLRWKY